MDRHRLKVANTSPKTPLPPIKSLPSHEQWVFIIQERWWYRFGSGQIAVKSVKCIEAMFWHTNIVCVGFFGRLRRKERHE